MKKVILLVATGLFSISFYSCETESTAKTDSIYKYELNNEDASDKDEEPDREDRDSQ